jgi:hypothetical protein
MKGVIILVLVCLSFAFVRSAVICPDETSCPNNNTCCPLEDGSYGCCPRPNATCCEDFTTCCPAQYTCDLEHGKCKRDLTVAFLTVGFNEELTKLESQN